MLRWHDQTFEMLDRALFWTDEGAIVVADVHLGKEATFASRGIPVPDALDHDLGRLTSLVESRGAASLIILGDLWHAPAGCTPDVLDRLRRFRDDLDVRLGATIRAVRGNHDRRIVPVLEMPERLEIRGIELVHDPEDRTRAALAGHVHPVARLSGSMSAVRAPCFWVRPDCIVLPAFGTFTGGRTIRPAPEDEVYLVDACRQPST
ncbi:MAG: ligase-associated DNA damage response endonuclease PdeM [Phycisphaerales bacterium]|nr:ligase-associated DNA damage response endonuclease PdeM [Phycisphaerales bacterium]